MSNTSSISNRRTKSREEKLEEKRSSTYNWREHDTEEPVVSRNERRQLENYNRRRAQAISKGQGDETSGSPVLNKNKFFDYHLASKSPSRTIMSQSSTSVSKLADARKEEERKKAEKVRLAEEKAKLAKTKAAEEEAKRLEDEVFTDNEDDDPEPREFQELVKSVDLSGSDEETDHTDRIYEESNDLMKSTIAKAIHLSESSFKDHGPLRRVWDEAVAAWQDFEGIARGIMHKEKLSVQREAASKRVRYFNKAADYYEENQKKIRKRIRHIRHRDERDALRKLETEDGYRKTAMTATTGNVAKTTTPGEKSPDMPTKNQKSQEDRHEQAEVTKVEAVKKAEAAQKLIEAAGQGQGGRCLPPGGDAGKEGSPLLPKAAVLCRGKLLCTPEAAEAAVLCQGRQRCTPEAAEAAVLCCVYKIFKGQAGLCLHSGGDAGKEGSPRLPKAAVLCQGRLLCT
jgi:hypothetical protein